MILGYDEKIYVFESWAEYDSGGMHSHEFQTEAELQAWLKTNYSDKQKFENALKHKELVILQGKPVVPKIKLVEVVSEFET